MKNYRLISLIFLITFTAGACFHVLRELRSKAKDVQRETQAIKVVLPDAQNFSEKGGNPPHYKGYQTSANTEKDLLGLAFVTTDLSPEIRGYAGPIKMMVGMDRKGSITKIYVISHSETPSYVFDLDTFLDQFRSRGVKDSFVLGKDIDGISRATISSAAMTRAVEKSLKLAGHQVLELETSGLLLEKKPSPIEQIIIPLILFGIAVLGVVSHNTIIRWTALAGGFLYFGIIKSTMVSVVHIANICLGKFPAFAQSPLWYMLIGLTLFTTLIWGMVFCGSLCPFAGVEEVIYNTFHKSKKRGLRKIELAEKLDRRARHLKYFVLLSALIVSVLLGNASAASLEPFLTLFTQKATGLGWTLLILMLFAAIFYFRFWCKYLCPVGACLGLMARTSSFKIKLGKNCIHCDICERICPTQAIRMNEEKLPVIDYPECILCGKCVQKCPKQSLSLRGFAHEKE